MQKLGPKQAVLKLYTSMDRLVIGSCIIFIHDGKQPQSPTFNITDIEGSVLSNCEYSLMLGVVAPRHKLKKLLQSTVNHKPSKCSDAYRLKENV